MVRAHCTCCHHGGALTGAAQTKGGRVLRAGRALTAVVAQAHSARVLMSGTRGGHGTYARRLAHTVGTERMQGVL